MLPHPFTLSTYLGTLAGDLGCFPLDRGTYLPRTDSRGSANGIRSLVRFGIPLRTLARPELYLRLLEHEAIPQYISGRTSYHGI